MAGSSPHTRGALPGLGTDPSRAGIIPAYAGSTAGRDPPRRAMADHPRIRGEHAGLGAGNSRPQGSSPHTRGARNGRNRRAPGQRIIPAYAGSTRRVRGADRSWRDHPRIRGEHTDSLQPGDIVFGSSPHTRGALPICTWEKSSFGIIPAYAGSTGSAQPNAPAVRDHPRIRGEHLPQTSCIADRQGSSPHTRGAPHMTPTSPLDSGIIPAYAGSTGAKWRRQEMVRDHPRIRGEHRCEMA